MAPKLLSGLAKVLKPKKRRNRKMSPDSTVATCANKPLVVSTSDHNGSSCTTASTCCSSSRPQSSITPRTVASFGEESTWCGSDSEAPGSPVARRPPMVTRSQSQQASTVPDPRRVTACGLRRSQTHTGYTTTTARRHTLPPLLHNKSLSFRLRKRNRALSDVDFDQLLTLSRGWTFDPSFVSSRHHTRQQAMAQTDFERYIFAPHGTTTKQLQKAPMDLSARSEECTREATPPPPVPKTEDEWEQEESIHPFFRPLDSCFC